MGMGNENDWAALSPCLQYTRFQQLTRVLWTRFQDQMPLPEARASLWTVWMTIRGAPDPSHGAGAILFLQRIVESTIVSSHVRKACRTTPTSP